MVVRTDFDQRLADEVTNLPKACWRKAEPGQQFSNGDKVVALVPVDDRGGVRWDVQFLTACCSEERFVGWCDVHGDKWLGWSWSDVVWWLPINEALPTLPSLEGVGCGS